MPFLGWKSRGEVALGVLKVAGWAVVVGMLVALMGCADECERLYCAPGDPAIEAYKEAERGGL